MEKLTEEKIKWFWEKCGLVYTEDETTFTEWRKANGDLICCGHDNRHPSIDLNNLISEYAVPAFRVRGKYPYITEIILEPTMCDTEMYYCYVEYVASHEDGWHVESEEAQGSSEDPGVALFNALCEMLNYE